MNDLQCVPSFSLRDMHSAIAFFTDVVGFELDTDWIDGPPEESMAVLRRGAAEIRLIFVLRVVEAADATFLCENATFWMGQLESAGFAPIMHRDAGDPLTVECQITDELRVTFEQIDLG